MDEKYCIVTVNAARARQGRINNKPNLLAKSGLNKLKDVILTELKRTTSFDILRSGIHQIEGVFIKLLESRENSEIVKRMNQVLRSFSTQKISMRRQINTFIDTKTEILGETLPQIIWRNLDSQAQIDAAVAKALEQLNEKVQREIQRQLKDVAEILSIEVKSFADISINSKPVDVDAFSSILNKLSDINKQSGDANINVSPANVDDVNQIGIAIGILTQSGTEIAKNFAKTAVGNIAGTALGKVASSKFSRTSSC